MLLFSGVFFHMFVGFKEKMDKSVQKAFKAPFLPHF
jgi:hypothetical protein